MFPDIARCPLGADFSGRTTPLEELTEESPFLKWKLTQLPPWRYFSKHYLGAKQRTECFAYIFSFHPHNHPMSKYYSHFQLRFWEVNVPMVTQLGSGRAWTWTQPVSLQTLITPSSTFSPAIPDLGAQVWCQEDHRSSVSCSQGSSLLPRTPRKKGEDLSFLRALPQPAAWWQSLESIVTSDNVGEVQAA